MGEEEFASKVKNYEFMDEEARKERNAKLDQELAELAQIRREKLDEQGRELEELKEKQAERRAAREKEMEEMAERLREVEERKKAEEEEKRAKLEEKRLRRLEKKKSSKNESEIPKNEEATMLMSEEERQAAKAEFIEAQKAKFNFEGLGTNDLRNKIKQLYDRMVKLEADKYDLEARQKEQEYDMKELDERQSQKMRNRAAAMGVDAEEAAKCKFPPKVRLYSKNDRQVDSRSYTDRKQMWNQPATKKVFKVFHGSGRPPKEWKPKEYDELESTFKAFEGFKYVETDPVEKPTPPAAFVPPAVPEKDAFEVKEATPPPLPTGGLGPGTYNP